MTKVKSKVTSKFIPKDTEVLVEHVKYDSAEEALKGEGAEKILALVNSQIRTNAMNVERAKYNSQPTKTALRKAALASITQEEFVSVMGDESKLEALLTQKMEFLAKNDERFKDDEDAD